MKQPRHIAYDRAEKMANRTGKPVFVCYDILQGHYTFGMIRPIFGELVHTVLPSV